MRLRLDKFAFRQWDDATYAGTRMPPGVSKTAFLEHVVALGPQPLADGYAPFCKHLFVRNFVPGLKGATVALTPDNLGLVESAYQARTEKELPVLVRWIPAERAGPRADAAWLDLILYSKEQIVSECRATGEADDTSGEEYDWGIVSVKAQDEPRELPMTPATMLRNALGREEGGSGVPLDRAAYLASVAYWSAHATIA